MWFAMVEEMSEEEFLKMSNEQVENLISKLGYPRCVEVVPDATRRTGIIYDKMRVDHKDFEKNNIVFDVIEESKDRFEVVVKRCLVFEAFNELGASALSQWMCDIGFEYFSGYHPRMKYEKDRMIARGDSTCHEVFTWE